MGTVFIPIIMVRNMRGNLEMDCHMAMVLNISKMVQCMKAIFIKGRNMGMASTNGMTVGSIMVNGSTI